jgi:hypothetical protein
VSLDEWQDKHVKAMVRWGNKVANEYWEAGVPEDFYIPVSAERACAAAPHCVAPRGPPLLFPPAARRTKMTT